MNIAQVYRMLSEALPNLALRFSEYNDSAKDYDYIFTELDNYQKAYKTVERFAPFLISSDAAASLKGVVDRGVSGYSTLTAKKNTGDITAYYGRALFNYVKGFLDYTGPSVVNNSREDTITVKLDHIKTLEEFEKTINQLKNALNTPVFELNGRTEIESVDSGSILIEIAIIAPSVAAVLKVIGDLVKTAVQIKKDYHESEILAEKAKSARMKNELLKEFVKALKEDLNLKKTAQAQDILNQYSPEKNTPENLNSFLGSIDLFGKLLEKGAEFFPSINAPEEIKKAFPTSEEQKQIESNRKLLGEGDNEEGDSEQEAEV